MRVCSENADLRSEAVRIGGNAEQRFGNSEEQHVEEYPRFL